MEQYQIGNEVKGVIRAYCPGQLGQEAIDYPGQPYTLIDGISATINFKDLDREGNSARNRILFHDMSFVDSIQLNNVKLTDKILNLIFDQQTTSLRTLTVSQSSDADKHIYLTIDSPILYNVFIYNEQGLLETYYEEGDITSPLEVQQPNSAYLIIYQVSGSYAVNLNKTNNFYLMLDLDIIGNIDNQTSHMYIHFDKCGLQIEKNMYFTQNSNAVDLTFKVINDNNTDNYIVLK